MSSTVNLHKKYLLLAHSLAKKKFGNTFPNPSVGCVLVKNNKIIAQASTGKNGRPHAEEIVLKKAGNKSIGSTLYVTLEPCNHKSEHGSCTDQIIQSRIKKIFIAKVDLDPRTKYKSIKKLKKNGIKINVGITSYKTDLLNKFFFNSLINKRPFIKVKMAISQDEKIAWKDYSSKWISNNKSRNYAHKLRAQSQAILTTSKTIIKDNPRFTIRNKNKIIKYMPVIIIDKNLKISLNTYLIKSLTKRRIIIFTSQSNRKFNKLKSLGCEIFLLKEHKNTNEFYLPLIMKKILSLNINNILVESGGIFFTKLLLCNLIDEFHIFKSSLKIGQSGKPMIINKKFKDLSLEEISKKKFGKDVYQQLIIKK
tara:strand:+ start:1475 stop:2572 length:1098 start_codon:yes stop_codon:yes gene_type:complete